MIFSDGISSDLLVDECTQIVTHFDECSVIRTPTQPNYWYGNCLIERRPPTNVDLSISRFRRFVDGANHICIQWDIENFDLGQISEEFESKGLKIERSEFLALNGPIQVRPAPAEYEFRPFSSKDDWDQSIKLQLVVDAETEAHDPEKYLPFLESRAHARQQQIARGRGQWFGAFDRDLLVGDLGIFCDDRVARYQSVQTRASHRKRGICSALMALAHDWAKAQSPEARVLIAADADDTPRFLYRQLGFVPFETIVSVVKDGY